jgi:hypothetical protein
LSTLGQRIKAVPSDAASNFSVRRTFGSASIPASPESSAGWLDGPLPASIAPAHPSVRSSTPEKYQYWPVSAAPC